MFFVHFVVDVGRENYEPSQLIWMQRKGEQICGPAEFALTWMFGVM